MSLKFDPGAAELTAREISTLKEMRTRCARRILLSTSLAASGHPGGSLSSLDMLLVAYGLLNHDPKNPRMEDRDRMVESIGHISPGVYSVLAENGYFTEDDFLAGFRRTGSGFPGHVESIVPGVEWDTGNLGQGLSTAVGMAHAFKIQGKPLFRRRARNKKTKRTENPFKPIIQTAESFHLRALYYSVTDNNKITPPRPRSPTHISDQRQNNILA
ncbi:MAG: hypothetical protein D3910_13960 [Candidatus Electrothrix sp. ATG2]|nr:hypothetical protein [Candidatus Electrothrix sp. ATG2]